MLSPSGFISGGTSSIASGGFLASIPTPTLTAELLPAEDGPSPSATAPNPPLAVPARPQTPAAPEAAPKAEGEAGVEKQAQVPAGDRLYEVLFILRNLKEAPEPPAEQ